MRTPLTNDKNRNRRPLTPPKTPPKKNRPDSEEIHDIQMFSAKE